MGFDVNGGKYERYDGSKKHQFVYWNVRMTFSDGIDDGKTKNGAYHQKDSFALSARVVHTNGKGRGGRPKKSKAPATYAAGSLLCLSF